MLIVVISICNAYFVCGEKNKIEFYRHTHIHIEYSITLKTIH